MSYARAALLVLLAGCSPATTAPGGGGSGGSASGGGGSPVSGATPGDGASGTVPRHTATVIRVHYPAGTHALALRGDGGGLSWSAGRALTAESDDSYSLSLLDLAAPLAFKPLLDDATWSRGPNYTVEPGAAVDIYPRFAGDQGSVVKLIPAFSSTALGNTRAIWAYLPPSYAENTRARFPVLYMHDGQNLFDPALAYGGNEWKVDETLDAAAVDGSIRELIVIGVENTADRIHEYTPTPDPGHPEGGGGDQYLALLVDELKPQIDQMLRTLPDRAHTGILGSSLGGLISAYAGVRRPDVYGLVGAMSPSTWWDGTVIIGDVMGMPAASRPDRVYVDCGDASDDRDNTNMLAATYVSLGYRRGVDFLQVLDDLGQHNEIYWALRLPGALGFLFGPR